MALHEDIDFDSSELTLNRLYKPAHTKLVGYSSVKHLDSLVDLLLDLQETDAFYPPRVGLKLTAAELVGWLTLDPVLQRWVALRDKVVIGHISIANPHDYILDFLRGFELVDYSQNPFTEIGQFFVQSSDQRSGAGKLLFEEALSFSSKNHLKPILAVIDGSSKARSFYAAQGLEKLGEFKGIHGINHVFSLKSSAQEN